MQAESVLLEPWYAFTLTVPANQVGRGITDIRAMGGEAEPPEQNGEFAVLRGRLPVASLGDYPQEVAAYTQGRAAYSFPRTGTMSATTPRKSSPSGPTTRRRIPPTRRTARSAPTAAA